MAVCRFFIRFKCDIVIYFRYICIAKLRKECNLLEMSVG